MNLELNCFNIVQYNNVPHEQADSVLLWNFSFRGSMSSQIHYCSILRAPTTHKLPRYPHVTAGEVNGGRQVDGDHGADLDASLQLRFTKLVQWWGEICETGGRFCKKKCQIPCNKFSTYKILRTILAFTVSATFLQKLSIVWTAKHYGVVFALPGDRSSVIQHVGSHFIKLCETKHSLWDFLHKSGIDLRASRAERHR